MSGITSIVTETCFLPWLRLGLPSAGSTAVHRAQWWSQVLYVQVDQNCLKEIDPFSFCEADLPFFSMSHRGIPLLYPYDAL